MLPRLTPLTEDAVGPQTSYLLVLWLQQIYLRVKINTSFGIFL